MRTSLTAAVLLVILVVVSASAFGGPNLAGTMEARKIVMGKENREIAVSAEKVYPQDKIEYTLRYRNVGDASASGVSLVGPIPAGTVYLEKTATENGRDAPALQHRRRQELPRGARHATSSKNETGRRGAQGRDPRHVHARHVERRERSRSRQGSVGLLPRAGEVSGSSR